MPVALFFFFGIMNYGMHRKLWKWAKIYKFGFDLLEEVGHTTKCCHFGRMKFFSANFVRSLIRACTGSFANV